MNEIDKLNAIGFTLIHACREANAEEMKLKLTDVKHHGVSVGNWEIVVRKI